jgi:hypothetical protein
MFSLFCAYVIKTAIYMYLYFHRVWSLFLFLNPPFFFLFLFLFFLHPFFPNDKNLAVQSSANFNSLIKVCDELARESSRFQECKRFAAHHRAW